MAEMQSQNRLRRQIDHNEPNILKGMNDFPEDVPLPPEIQLVDVSRIDDPGR